MPVFFMLVVLLLVAVCTVMVIGLMVLAVIMGTSTMPIVLVLMPSMRRVSMRMMVLLMRMMQISSC